MYDFMVFGYYAAAIGRAYFPSGSELVSLLFSHANSLLGILEHVLATEAKQRRLQRPYPPGGGIP